MGLFRKTERAEDPARLKRFLEAMANADWQGKPLEALDALFAAINELAYHEVLFYYAARKKQRRFSVATRTLAISFGTAGVLLPLIAGANPADYANLSVWGYPLLAVAAAVLVVNRFFGATGGHIRYVTAQLELEHLITAFRLDWYRLRSCFHSVADCKSEMAGAFLVFRRFIDSFYKVIQEETTVWGKSVSEALEEYARSVSVNPKTKSDSKATETSIPGA